MLGILLFHKKVSCKISIQQSGPMTAAGFSAKAGPVSLSVCDGYDIICNGLYIANTLQTKHAASVFKCFLLFWLCYSF